MQMRPPMEPMWTWAVALGALASAKCREFKKLGRGSPGLSTFDLIVSGKWNKLFSNPLTSATWNRATQGISIQILSSLGLQGHLQLPRGSSPTWSEGGQAWGQNYYILHTDSNRPTATGGARQKHFVHLWEPSSHNGKNPSNQQVNSALTWLIMFTPRRECFMLSAHWFSTQILQQALKPQLSKSENSIQNIDWSTRAGRLFTRTCHH